ncbi:hypothetical protein LCGC14_0798590 [marine sediment metagenome]|uniref:Uncharacterized protein n=1 Tax=marine sediment metagenome TaxID=412755 RepID=A0A0F9SAC1_9ZZZZ
MSGSTIIYGHNAAQAPVAGLSEAVVTTFNALLVDPSGRPLSRFNSAGDATSIVVKASEGLLDQILVFNANPIGPPGDLFLHIFDLAALPANGTVPDFTSVPIRPQGSQGISFDPGLPMATGIVLAASTTRTTLTLAGAVMWFAGRFN